MPNQSIKKMNYNILEPWKTLDPWQKEYIETDGNFPEGKFFRVRTCNGLRFELTYLTNEDKWTINDLYV